MKLCDHRERLAKTYPSPAFIGYPVQFRDDDNQEVLERQQVATLSVQ